MIYIEQPVDIEVFRFFWNRKLDSLFARLSFRYLLIWGLETNSLTHELALTYLLNREIKNISLLDRLALTYVLIRKGFQRNSLFDRLVRAYVVHRGLETRNFFDILARSFVHLCKRSGKPQTLFEKMALMYLVKRCDEAVHKGLSVVGLEDVVDLAEVEGINFINQNLQRILKTPLAWQTAKIVVACRVMKAFYEENTHEFEYTAELGYWTAALHYLRELEKEEN
uniref:Uncharacterized protein n=1 Tax=Lobelia urens TaxID=1053365 RepID=A0A1Z2R561_9ASTR|nr:hypothetical protein Lo_ure1Pt0570 [Lobelia urens]ASA38832.1 hypothetical protein Lo_ure1Pt0570 [Lobelia urens]